MVESQKYVPDVEFIYYERKRCYQYDLNALKGTVLRD